MSWQIIQGDCIEVMARMPEASVDLVLTDPPYGTTMCKWDAVIPFIPMWERLRATVKRDGVIALHASQPFTSALVMSNPKLFRYEWIWEKSKATGYLDARRKPMKAHESILIFCAGKLPYNPQLENGKPYINRHRVGDNGDCYGAVRDYSFVNNGTRFPRTVKRFDSVPSARQIHPTQKPVELLRYLIRTYSNEGDIILDFTCGSGSTGVACLLENRRFIGIEKDEKYVEIARQRLIQTQVRDMETVHK